MKEIKKNETSKLKQNRRQNIFFENQTKTWTNNVKCLKLNNSVSFKWASFLEAEKETPTCFYLVLITVPSAQQHSDTQT